MALTSKPKATIAVTSEPIEANALRMFIVGGMSGSTEVFLMQPTMAWKNALQGNRPVPFTPSKMYRGVWINVLSIAPVSATQFAGNTALTAFLRKRNGSKPLSELQKMSVAATAGALSGLISTPAELVMITQQRLGVSLWGGATQIIGSNGLAGLYRGLAPTLYRESGWTMALLGVAPITRNWLKTSSLPLLQNDATCNLLGSILAGQLSAIVTHPFDTVKTRMQSDIGPGALKYRGIGHTFTSLYQEGGMKIFFSGFIPRAGRITCAVYIINEVSRRLSDQFDRWGLVM